MHHLSKGKKMCRGKKEPAARRCIAHSAPARSADRAEARLEETLDDWLSGVKIRAKELTLEAGPEPREAEKALSIWILAWRELMTKLANSVARLDAKREKLKVARQERDAERLAKILDVTRRETASQAIAKHEAAIEALYRAQEKQRDLELLAAIDAAAQEFGSRFEIVQAVLADADAAWAEAHAETERLREAVTPADETTRLTGPRKGLPGPSMSVFLAAQKREQFWLTQHNLIAEKLRTTPSREATLQQLAAMNSAVEAGKKFVVATRAVRDAALTTGRPRKMPTEDAEQLPKAA